MAKYNDFKFYFNMLITIMDRWQPYSNEQCYFNDKQVCKNKNVKIIQIKNLQIFSCEEDAWVGNQRDQVGEHDGYHVE